MFGKHRRGFDWKEIAEVLHMTRGRSPVVFWREIKRSRLTKIGALPSAIDTQEQREPDSPKLPKPGASR